MSIHHDFASFVERATTLLPGIDSVFAEVVCVAFVANCFADADAFWVMVLGAPSDGKTEVTRSLTADERVEMVASLTPQTFISGWRDSKSSHASLLHRLSASGKKVIYHKDFNTIFALRSEHRSEVLSQLGEIYDGAFARSFGTGADLRWSGKLGLIGCATTEAMDRHAGVFTQLGPRFVLLRVRNPKRLEATSAALSARSEAQLRQELATAFKEVTRHINAPRLADVEFSPEIVRTLAELCDVAVHGRSSVPRDVRTREVVAVPTIEGAARFAKQVRLALAARAVLCGRSTVTMDDVRLAVRLARDAFAPALRLQVLDALANFSAPDMWMSLQEIREAVIGPSESTVRRCLEDLELLGLVISRDEADEHSHGVGHGDRLAKEVRRTVYSTAANPGLELILGSNNG